MKILIILFITITLYSDAKKEMYNLYKNEKYIEACNTGLRNFSKYANNEDYISLYAFSCLEADYIDRLATPLTKLKFTKESRNNAAYLSVIFMQKKLLYHALIDGYDLSSFNFPTTNHIISKVFDFYSKLEKNSTKEYYLFQDKNDKLLVYKLYLLKGNGLSKIVIEEIYNNKIIKRHRYW